MTGYPDYSSRHKIIGNVNSNYTIQEDGFVKVVAAPASNGTFAVYLNINNANIFSVCIANAIVPTAQSSQFFPVKAGDIVQQYGATNLGSDSGVWFTEKR